ncbi:uncharacterized protein LOC127720285 [Mytilus californianus]|uniref:uncharacterized protein LOC127720285 n=1 Tax=Mytilus californianus TaxID=6549 RepID=UPI0022467D74|nr:uncharacterized protein LOC127720285 [Mytilus californianus]
MNYLQCRMSKHLITKVLLRRSDLITVNCLIKANVSFKTKNTQNEIFETLNTYTDLKLTPLKINKCEFGKSFSRAHIQCEKFTCTMEESGKQGKIVPAVSFKGIYNDGFDFLNNYINGKLEIDLSDPADVNRTSAFFQLYKFFSKIEDHERCLKRDSRNIFTDKPKSYVTALLTNHLLSKLVLGKEHITSRDLSDRPLFCPCFSAVKCQKPIEYGHTGLGYEKFWYGRPDVLLSADNEVQQNCVMVSEDRKTNNQSSDFEKELCSDIDEKTKEEEVAWISQTLAQCITFAFSRSNMKKRYSNKAFTSTLIPTLVLTPNDYFVYMYEYEHDVLLKSGPSDLWDKSGQKFNSAAILHLWMLLNHMNFVPCLSQNQVNYLGKSANFHNISGEKFTLSELTENVSFKSCFVESNKAHDMNLYPEIAIY